VPIYGLYYSTMVHLFTGIYVRKLRFLIIKKITLQIYLTLIVLKI